MTLARTDDLVELQQLCARYMYLCSQFVEDRWHEVFTPDDHIVDKTHRIIAAMKDAAAEGRGAVSLDGRLIDAASIRMAENLLAKLEQIEARDPVEVAPEPVHAAS